MATYAEHHVWEKAWRRGNHARAYETSSLMKAAQSINVELVKTIADTVGTRAGILVWHGFILGFFDGRPMKEIPNTFAADYALARRYAEKHSLPTKYR
jgi:hypothetical protein